MRPHFQSVVSQTMSRPPRVTATGIAAEEWSLTEWRLVGGGAVGHLSSLGTRTTVWLRLLHDTDSTLLAGSVDLGGFSTKSEMFGVPSNWWALRASDLFSASHSCGRGEAFAILT